MNSIQRQIQPLSLQMGFNVNSIQRQIQPLNPQIGFNVNTIHRIQCEFHSKSDSTIKPSEDSM